MDGWVDNFVEQQAHAWQEIVAQMRKEPMFNLINGASVNGPGSSLEYTKNLREQLPDLIHRYNITTMVDAPCGDFTWMQHTDIFTTLHSYIGYDVDAEIIKTNRAKYRQWRNVGFARSNLLTRKKWPHVDLILCRDFLAHLPNEYILEMVEKFRASGSRYLLASNYPGTHNEFTYDPEQVDAPWLGYMERPHDLTKEPFWLHQIDAIPEQSPPGGVIARQHELALFQL
jgi:hypothetical protein